MRLAQMVEAGYNTGVNRIKSDGLLSQHRHPFSTCDRGARTMHNHTLPISFLQEEVEEIPLTQGKAAIVDAVDFEWLSQWKWCAYRDGKTWYARRSGRSQDGKRITVSMHREILDAHPGVEVDHRNADGLDNRRVNLRLATKAENGRNRLTPINNTSGYKGVYWHERHRKWYAQITVEKKRAHLGHFDSAEDAARAYDKVAKEVYGDFANTNFPQSGVSE